jgi:preprotein translocase subunit SecF
MTRNIPFMANRKYAFIFSGLLTLISIISLATHGLKLGLDFTGGVLVEASYQQGADLNELRQNLNQNGLSEPSVQYFGSTKEVLIRLKPMEGMTNAQVNTKVLTAINNNPQNPVEIRRVEFVGPQVGETLAQDGFLALLYSSIGILIYVAWRFEWKFSVGAMLPLFTM